MEFDADFPTEDIFQDRKRDYTVMAAAVIEAASSAPLVCSHQETIRSVRETTDFEAADVARVVMEFIELGVLSRAIDIRNRGSALTPLGEEIHRRMRQLGDFEAS